MFNITLSGCSEVQEHCDDADWGGGIAHWCPKTCGLCAGGGGPISKPGQSPPAMLHVSRQAKEGRSHLKRALCFDDDANLRHAAAKVGETVKNCEEVAEHCDHPEWGHGIMFFCPATCGLCNDCKDDDQHLIDLAAMYSITLSGCSDVVPHCGDPDWGHGLG